MNTTRFPRSWMAAALALLLGSGPAFGQGGLTLANPHWNITLTDFGYSDFLLDNTPGFEGREYLSGEWGAAVGYQVSGGTERHGAMAGAEIPLSGLDDELDLHRRLAAHADRR